MVMARVAFLECLLTRHGYGVGRQRRLRRRMRHQYRVVGHRRIRLLTRLGRHRCDRWGRVVRRGWVMRWGRAVRWGRFGCAISPVRSLLGPRAYSFAEERVFRTVPWYTKLWRVENQFAVKRTITIPTARSSTHHADFLKSMGNTCKISLESCNRTLASRAGAHNNHENTCQKRPCECARPRRHSLSFSRTKSLTYIASNPRTLYCPRSPFYVMCCDMERCSDYLSTWSLNQEVHCYELLRFLRLRRGRQIQCEVSCMPQFDSRSVHAPSSR